MNEEVINIFIQDHLIETISYTDIERCTKCKRPFSGRYPYFTYETYVINNDMHLCGGCFKKFCIDRNIDYKEIMGENAVKSIFKEI